ncbi:DUF3304 domain-containing protein [Xenorhabdus szentirmaii]|uniref:Lipoprotein n=2 Tax=Xenorhabdus szentirmaii TaxID=290112 RepID=W1IWA7_9GAMM|nr:DUF3304 domain-containing protein [Xenorhabdus szentirmaii]PHM35227.1 hypothetical protein Xsze_01694 [Xenorhabdus szentirmaii DSM 16338]PHM44028.1 hypothetical protein Xszus_03852 [Xenorhabdus szentirmaii]CDL82113.1 conserved exported hypothetical protein [Xenorhabdus szentirmaii DSM 16338]
MERVKEIMKGSMILLGLLISGCSLANNDGWLTGNLRGMNHTTSEITRFSVDGYGGLVGGNTCCISLPVKWHPGLKAHVKWKSSSKKLTSTFPGYEDSEKYSAWEKEVLKNQVQHEAIVDIPEYDDPCPLTVHFLTCNQVKVTTACAVYGAPNYPINEPLNMTEPATCSK